MTLRVVSPAPIAEAMALFMDTAPAKPITFKVAMVQLARSRTDAFYAGDELVAVACYYPLAANGRPRTSRPAARQGSEYELTFACRPAIRRHLVAFVRLADLTRVRLAQDGPVRVRAMVRSGHLPGRRLALLCGLRLVETVNGFERWEFEGPDGSIRRRHQIAVHRAGHVGSKKTS